MLPRVLEPEVMDDANEAKEYDAMDHSQVNARFVQDLLQSEMIPSELDEPLVLDVGTGTALIPIELCQRHPHCRVLASDASVPMLELARINVAVSLLEHRIQFHHGDANAIEFDDALFDWVISNSLIHHTPEPVHVLAEMWRVLKPGGILFVRDLKRPESADELEQIVAAYAGHESLASQQLLRQSLHAALTTQEVATLAQSLGIPPVAVSVTSDRHWTLSARRLEASIARV
jgi:ubiquinone/menaquinone biosynthesis C-methylase UbiE